jgi:nucleoside-diphosphate-sugar epimerase
VIDSTLARNEFGWAPKISIEEGIKEVIDWVNKYWKEMEKMPLGYEHKA